MVQCGAAQATSGELDMRIRALEMVAFSWIARFLLVALPAVAAYIGGGAVFNTALVPMLALTNAFRQGLRAQRMASASRTSEPGSER